MVSAGLVDPMLAADREAIGSGDVYDAKAMAREAGVPFLFVSATSFQSMYYGATARKIRSYFKALRKAARKEGGAIGFIEEIDAIAMARGGVASGTRTSGVRASLPLVPPRRAATCGFAQVLHSVAALSGAARLRRRDCRFAPAARPRHSGAGCGGLKE